MSGSFQREDAFLVGLHLRDFPRHEYWEDGQRAPMCDLERRWAAVADDRGAARVRRAGDVDAGGGGTKGSS